MVRYKHPFGYEVQCREPDTPILDVMAVCQGKNFGDYIE